MADSLAQLDAAIASLTTAETNAVALTQQLDTDVQALVAKLEAAGNTDFTNEVNAIQAAVGTLNTALTNVQSADTAAQGAVGTSTNNPPVSAAGS